MKKLLLLSLILLPLFSVAQTRKFSTFYHQRASLFEELLTSTEDIIFLGNSITNGGEWCELFADKNVKNRGISSDITEGVLNRLATITKGQPKKVFLLIGVNDLAGGKSPEKLVENVEEIVIRIQKESPKTDIYLQSILPVNKDFNMFGGHISKVKEIIETNAQMKALATRKDVTYIDLYSHFVEKGTDKMNPAYTNDGLHLLGKGYMLWRDIVKPYLK